MYGSIISNLVLPQSVTSLAGNIFSVSNIKDVIINSDALAVGGAFHTCSSLSSATFTSHSLSLSASSSFCALFASCNNLSSVNFPNMTMS